MIRWLKKKLSPINRDERGTALIIVTLAIPAIFGFAAFAVDLGYTFYIQSRLQNAADLGALAGGTLLVSGDKDAVTALARDYTEKNLPSGWLSQLGSIKVTPNIDVGCSTQLENAGVTCYAKPGSTDKINYVKVTVDATAPLFFANALGKASTSLSADAAVAGQGNSMPPLNVAIVLDTTKSMEMETTLSCGGVTLTKVECAKKAALGMLGTLWPTVDKVALYTYPGMSQGTGSSPNAVTAAQNISKNICGNSKATVTDYKKDSNPAKYQIIDFSDDYRTKTEPPPAGVLPGSDLVKALGGNNGCTGLQTGSNIVYTFYADTIDKAQADLKAVNDSLKNAGKATRQNVIVILSDGDANATTSYIESARTSNQCLAGINAAQAATADGTWVYSVAYAASTQKGSSGSCKFDTSSIAAVNVSTVTTTITYTQTYSNSQKKCGTVQQSNPSNSQPVVTTVAAPGPTPGRSATVRSPSPTPVCSSSNRNITYTDTYTTVTVTPSNSPMTQYDRSACDAMRAMASTPDKFFSIDPPGMSGGCVSEANPTTTDLLSIFKKVATSLMKKRRVPRTAI